MAQISFDACLCLIDDCIKAGVLKAGTDGTVCERDGDSNEWHERQTLDFALELMGERQKRNKLMTQLAQATGKKGK